MEVLILDKVWEYPNQLSSIDRLLDNIEELLQESGVYLTSLKIDDIEIFEDYRDYMVEHLKQIKKIQVISQTLEEMTNNILLTTEQYLNRSLPYVDILTTEFYQGTTSDTWEKFEQLLEGLQWTCQMIGTLDRQVQFSIQHPKFHNISIKLNDSIVQLNEATENKDSILIGDTLSYELSPLLNELYDELQKTIDNKVVRTNVN